MLKQKGSGVNTKRVAQIWRWEGQKCQVNRLKMGAVNASNQNFATNG